MLVVVVPVVVVVVSVAVLEVVVLVPVVAVVVVLVTETQRGSVPSKAPVARQKNISDPPYQFSAQWTVQFPPVVTPAQS